MSLQLFIRWVVPVALLALTLLTFLRYRGQRKKCRRLERVNADLNRQLVRSKKLFKERERLVSELESRNAEMERFVYAISHDLKNPLLTIRAFLGILVKDADAGDAERMRQDIDQIQLAASNLTQLLDELLELSRIGRMMNEPQNVPLDDLAREAVDQVAARLPENAVEFEIAPGLPDVFGDRPRLLDVLVHLIANAVKFMGGQPRPRVEIGLRRQGDDAVCFVKDNGIGIDPRYHEKVFGLFERLDQSVDGTGLGLALVKRIIEVHGGRIWAESAGQGRGATFCFVLPESDSSRTWRIRGQILEELGRPE